MNDVVDLLVAVVLSSLVLGIVAGLVVPGSYAKLRARRTARVIARLRARAEAELALPAPVIRDRPYR